MCGIGAVLLAPTRPDSVAILQRYAPLLLNALAPRGPDHQASVIVSHPAKEAPPTCPSPSPYPFLLTATTLHIRGPSPTPQPLRLSPSSSLLLFNGELFSTLSSQPTHNDGLLLLAALLDAPSPLPVLASTRGPYSLFYYDAVRGRLWIGRDRYGRRSLLVRWGKRGLAVSSVAVEAVEEGEGEWEELPPTGLLCVDLARSVEEGALCVDVHYAEQYREAAPSLPASRRIGSVKEAYVEPSILPSGRHAASFPPTSIAASAAVLLSLLSASVATRVSHLPPPRSPASASVAILFSGGLDSTLLAYLAHTHLPSHEPIDLVNVAFIGHMDAARATPYLPDRLTALNALKELQKAVGAARTFSLVCVDVTMRDVEENDAAIRRLVWPRRTVMDFCIGVVMFFGARATGRVVQAPEAYIDSPHCRYKGICSAAMKPCAGPTVEESVDETLTASRGEVPAQLAEDDPRRTNPLHGFTSNTALRREKVRQRSEQRRTLTQNHRGTAGSDDTQSLPSIDDFLPFSMLHSSSSPPLPPPFAAMYTSGAKVLLTGIGADEMLAGYSRHRTTYVRSSRLSPSPPPAAVLSESLSSDFDRLWLRNLGRDDRLVAHHGREARFPFLDEAVVEWWRGVHLDDIAVMEGEGGARGVGDKAVLREAARHVGLRRTAGLEKRAMQFGSRVGNRRLAGDGNMDATVSARDVVNPAFLHPELRSARTLPNKKDTKRQQRAAAG